MLTTTAVVLMTLTSTPQVVSPTVTPTYTAGEMRAFKHGVRRSFCAVSCGEYERLKDHYRSMKEAEKEIYNKLKEIGVSDPYDAGLGDASFYKNKSKQTKEQMRELKKHIEDRKDCNCDEFKDKK